MHNKLEQALTNVKTIHPLVHHLTNYVTVNDCANITLAIGGSPVMADAIEEVTDMASVANSVVINMGTLNERTVASMILAGKAANGKGTPVIFDPVGVGASVFRNEMALKILKEVKCSVIRGNASEIRFLVERHAATKGVDVASADTNIDVETLVKEGAKKLGCIVACTGAVDYISDGKQLVKIYNGHAMLSSITGTGCMCTSLIGTYCGANTDIFIATCAALLSMGMAGENAYTSSGHLGLGHYHMAIIDEISKLDATSLLERARYETNNS
ncbi:hydroxyethylthiazole kinase [Erysipelotrichaceae bacterium MTC7]|nr:hydroxyethylthiazole kinase [Erysipelotrichaceae bacterium MTC7]